MKKYKSFYKTFTKKWQDIYYEKFLQSAIYINIIILLNLIFTLELILYFQLLEKYYLKRGFLSTCIKRVIFFIYKSDQLPYINTSASNKKIS